MTPAQEIAKLKAQVAKLEGEIKGLQYAVAVHPYPIPYVTSPVPCTRPHVPYYGGWQTTSGVAAAQTSTPPNTLQAFNGAGIN